MCNGKPPLCNLCLAHHDIMHFSFLEDIETLINPQKIIQIKEIASEMKRRLERDAKEAAIIANPSSMLVQFQKCVEENKAKLMDCFLKNVITQKNEEVKAELKSIKDKLDRKYRLIVETNGQDSKIMQDFLLTYVRGMTRFKELADAIKTGTVGTDVIAKKYLQGVEEIFESVRRFTKVKFEEVSSVGKTPESQKKPRSLASEIESKKESTCRIEEYYSDEDDEDCKIIGVTPPKKAGNKWTRRENLLLRDKEPPRQKKVKYNATQKPLVSEESKMSSRSGEMDVEYKISGKSCVSGCDCLIHFLNGGEEEYEKSSLEENSANLAGVFDELEELSPERSGDEDQEKYVEKLRKDYRACAYPKPIKDLVMLIFSMRANRKYISREVNTKLLSIRRISKRDIKKISEILTEIYEILTGPKQSTPEAALQVAKLSKDFYHVIPFNNGNELKRLTLTAFFLRASAR